ncbi:MAG: DUF1214 domain-containing protein [Bacteroidales bacterium]|nr:DUF1214 domain-containing protein [Bacteroidales bacterium]
MKKLAYLTVMALMVSTVCQSQSSCADKAKRAQAISELVAKQDDPVITVAPSLEIGQLGDYYDAKAVGTLAYEWGYALVRMEQAMREYTDVPVPKPRTSYRAPLNEIGWATRLPNAGDKDMPTANNDTYYMSAVVDLTEPYILETPDTDGRYYVVNVFDMYHTLQEYIGKRNTGTKAQKVALIPPGWTGKLPQDVTKTVQANTNKVWLWGRIHVLEGEDVSKVHALQEQFELKTLSELNGQKTNKTASLPPMPKYEVSDSLRFYRYLAFAMGQNEMLDEDKSLVGQMERIGITPGKFDEASLNAAQIKGLKEAALEGPIAILATMFSQTTTVNGWNVATKLDNYGYDYGFRSHVAGPYLGGQGEREAMYPIRFIDSNNEPFAGVNSYRIKFDEEPPVNAFWSLTLYDASNKLFVDNELNRYKFSGESKGLKYNEDGSFEILIQNEKPENTDNWLPAPKGGFYLILRLYEPKENAVEVKYQIPQVVKVNK